MGRCSPRRLACDPRRGALAMFSGARTKSTQPAATALRGIGAVAHRFILSENNPAIGLDRIHPKRAVGRRAG
jgi:hypothetical protein